MVVLCLLLIPLSLAVSLPATWLMIRVGRRAAAFDTAGVEGQIKDLPRSVPNTGGVAIFAGVALPMLAALLGIVLADGSFEASGFLAPLGEHAEGVRDRLPMALLLLGSLLALHVLGVIDDRRPLPPIPKLVVMLGLPLLVATGAGVTEPTRLLELLDPYVGGPWLSVLITVLWFAAVVNAVNFIDNMDGLCGGVTVIASSLFLVTALTGEQWFVAACLALLIGSALGFLVFNRPKARVFMGDGGSLVIGFLLAFLTVRTTYADPAGGRAGEQAAAWYGVFMPIAVLAVPLYDLISVTLIRLRQGHSPLVGDLQHFSHRLVKRGMTRPAAVGVICALTLAAGVSGLFIGRLEPWRAAIAGLQPVVILAAVALAELASSPAGARRDSLETAANAHRGGR